MQYPIIDLITSAYINNGWTGLDISTGKNLFNVFSIIPSQYVDVTNDGNVIVTGNGRTSGKKLKECADLIEGETYILTARSTGTANYLYLYGTNNSWYFSTPRTITNNDLESYIWFYGGLNTTSTISDIMIRISTDLDPTYEPYNPTPSNDFTNRLKLPLLHYFPHPVIDALTRASNGTLTDNDKQILRHYLTPLGIGGI